MVYGNFNQRRSFAPVKVGEELDVKIEAVGEKGDGVCKKNGFVLFVPGVKEGDEVKVRVTKVLRRVGFAELVGKGTPAKAEKPKKSKKTEQDEYDEDQEENEFEGTQEEEIEEEENNSQEDADENFEKQASNSDEEEYKDPEEYEDSENFGEDGEQQY